MFYVDKTGKSARFPKIAEYMGMGVTGTQCTARWHKIKTAGENRKKGEWSEEEVDSCWPTVE